MQAAYLLALEEIKLRIQALEAPLGRAIALCGLGQAETLHLQLQDLHGSHAQAGQQAVSAAAPPSVAGEVT